MRIRWETGVPKTVGDSGAMELRRYKELAPHARIPYARMPYRCRFPGGAYIRNGVTDSKPMRAYRLSAIGVECKMARS